MNRSARPTLYALLGKRARLSVQNGDSINELRTLGTLSHHFDVFYNNEPFDAGKSEIGDAEPGPSRAYDYYYVRNSPGIFRQIRGRKLNFAYPYDEEAFADSYGLVVLTENWKDHLLGRDVSSDEKIKAIYDGVRPRITQPVLNVGQVCDPVLADCTVAPRDLFEMRYLTTGTRIFGYYGNLNKDLYPYKAFAALERVYLDSRDRSPMIVLAGSFRRDSFIRYRNTVHVGQIPYDRMPALHDNTIANLTNESPLNHCLGNQKVIDSLSRAVPVMCQRLDTFVSQLGDDYPCFYETEEQAFTVARRLMEDADFLDHARRMSRARAERFRPDEVARRFLAQPELGAFD